LRYLNAKNQITAAERDRRIVLVELSERGRRLHQSCLDCQIAMGRTMLEALSPGEREIFLELMVKMTQPAATDGGRESV
jgi:DNA-binding MarR family transcriptional regulator